ncbi:MAG TPA: response regulator [Acetobacteraceae bacterium]|nr:response regulator [Acetobacteraceae bacterium]
MLEAHLAGPRRCRILHLEDSAADAELVAARLRRDGVMAAIERVQTRRAFMDALANGAFDVILADFSLPDFDGVAALAIARELAPDTPFIFVSGMLGEETAIEAMRAGATDYVVKERLGRLAVVVRRALAEAAGRAERRAAAAALRESEARFRHMADSAPALIWMTDARGQVAFANMQYDHLFGRPASEMLGLGWESTVLPEDLDRYRAAFQEAFRTRGPFKAVTRVRDKAGRVRWLRCEGVPRLDGAGTFLGYTGCNVDITEARLAAEELERRVAERTAELSQALTRLHEEVREREQAEEALRHAQKMEAVGQLTGGIAHDFNNMLTGIAGCLELIQRRMEQGRVDNVARYVEAGRKGVERAAALTARLLAFARRQALQPRPLVVDGLVLGMVELIRRTVGPSVEVQTTLASDGWTVLCDANQLESALLNLAINARDAMPDGGTLTLATAERRLSEADLVGQDGAKPGEYVEIAVSDTGEGMSPEVAARAFEPFFTTKPLGQGTGLGLSQLYGFVHQSEGFVRLESAPGHGTTIRLYLPRREVDANPLGAAPPRPAEECAGGGRTVLVVEDEAPVRALVAEVLREQGHRVLEAVDGPAGLRLLLSESPLDLLVTDVGLPGLNGRQLADAARERRPGLPVLFITGYAGHVLEGQLAPGMQVIGKPFALDTLTGKIGAMLRGGLAR